jgi:cation diffusion facilitator CzcD-associated flavoprotein CzcO
MVSRKFTLAERWQAGGMSQACFTNKRVAVQTWIHHSVIDCFMQRFQATGMVNERPRSGRPKQSYT